MACEKEKLNADYYVKTFHHDRYWSATPPYDPGEEGWSEGFRAEHDKFHDNMWCLDPEKTAAFMETVDKPWVAFKVLAAVRHLPPPRLLLRLPRWCRLRRGRDVRLPGRGGRPDRRRGPPSHRDPAASALRATSCAVCGVASRGSAREHGGLPQADAQRRPLNGTLMSRTRPIGRYFPGVGRGGSRAPRRAGKCRRGSGIPPSQTFPDRPGRRSGTGSPPRPPVGRHRARLASADSGGT